MCAHPVLSHLCIANSPPSDCRPLGRFPRSDKSINPKPEGCFASTSFRQGLYEPWQQWPKRSGHCKIPLWGFGGPPPFGRLPDVLKTQVAHPPSRLGPAPARTALQKAHMRTSQHSLTENPTQKSLKVTTHVGDAKTRAGMPRRLSN